MRLRVAVDIDGRTLKTNADIRFDGRWYAIFEDWELYGLTGRVYGSSQRRAFEALVGALRDAEPLAVVSRVEDVSAELAVA